MYFPARAELKVFDGIFNSNCHNLCVCWSFVLVLCCYHQIHGCFISTWMEFCCLYSQLHVQMCAEEFSSGNDCLRHKMLLTQSCLSDHRGLAWIWDSWPDAAASAILNFSCSPRCDFGCFKRRLIDAIVHSQMMV